MPAPLPTAVDPAALAAEEARLAHAAAEGDGRAFATLYERYEPRAYNLAYRLTGSEHDAADAVQDAFLKVLRRLPELRGRELAFGSYLFTAARNASYDLMQKRKRAEPSDSIPDFAAPLGAGAGGLGLDPGDPEEDPGRKLLLESQQDEIRAASLRLPERQREALALCELEDLSYDEIAEIMEMNRNSVAQLISRARIKLRDELRGSALASVAAASPDCERALPLIALRDDGQLDVASGDAAWLDEHLPACHTCRLSLEAMQEAGASYRMWAPIAAAPWLFDETMAKAAELVGADWSDVIATRSADRPEPASLPGMPRAYLAGAAPGEHRRRRTAIAAVLAAAVLLLGGLATLVVGSGSPTAPPEPAADPIAPPATETAEEPAPEGRKKPRPKARKEQQGHDEPLETTPGSPSMPSERLLAPAGDPRPKKRGRDRPQGTTRPPRDTVPSPDPEPDPIPEPAPQPTPPPVEDPPVTKPPTSDPTPPTRDPDPPPPPIL